MLCVSSNIPAHPHFLLGSLRRVHVVTDTYLIFWQMFDPFSLFALGSELHAGLDIPVSQTATVLNAKKSQGAGCGGRKRTALARGREARTIARRRFPVGCRAGRRRFTGTGRGAPSDDAVLRREARGAGRPPRPRRPKVRHARAAARPRRTADEPPTRPERDPRR